MNEQRVHYARVEMIEAFRCLSDLARQAGVDPDKITELHGVFFDGNVALKAALDPA